MKTAFACLACLTAVAPAADPEVKPVTRDAATHEQLAERLRAAQQSDPMKQLATATGPDPSVAAPPPDLLSQSDILCFHGTATLVPKRALLQMPKRWQERLQFKDGSRIMSWPEFLALNRAWIMTVEVTRAQAEGTAPLAEETLRRMSQSPNAVVATYQGGPISVLPPKSSTTSPSAAAPAAPAPAPAAKSR